MYSSSCGWPADLSTDDTEFCILPLTSDTALNPFRCREDTSQGSRLLFNSILALCFQHLNHLTGTWSAEAIEQRVNARKLLDDAFQSDQLIRRGLTLLDPILIMFTLDVGKTSFSLL